VVEINDREAAMARSSLSLFIEGSIIDLESLGLWEEFEGIRDSTALFVR
jgi:hypothetical protein